MNIFNTLEDTIWKRGTVDKIISDSSQVEITGCVKDLFRAYIAGNWSSEPHQQQQNLAKRKHQHMECTTNCMVGRT